jgi:hypothetical protein
VLPFGLLNEALATGLICVLRDNFAPQAPRLHSFMAKGIYGAIVELAQLTVARVRQTNLTQADHDQT